MISNKPIEQSDLWWLTKNIAIDSLLLGVGHHHPLADDDERFSVKWFRSIDSNKQMSYAPKQYQVSFIKEWMSICSNVNAYRTLQLYDQNTNSSPIMGPFLIDIDNEDENNSYEVNLEDALMATRKVIDFLIGKWQLSDGDIRIFFSGRKGFNIEIHPKSLNINGPIEEQITKSAMRLLELTNYLSVNNNSMISRKGTFIDQIYGGRHNDYELKHPFIRLHNSWNKWICQPGIYKARKRSQLTQDEIAAFTIEEICAVAERSE